MNTVTYKIKDATQQSKDFTEILSILFAQGVLYINGENIEAYGKPIGNSNMEKLEIKKKLIEDKIIEVK